MKKKILSLENKQSFFGTVIKKMLNWKLQSNIQTEFQSVAQPEIRFGGAVRHFWPKRPSNFKFLFNESRTYSLSSEKQSRFGVAYAPLHPSGYATITDSNNSHIHICSFIKLTLFKVCQSLSHSHTYTLSILSLSHAQNNARETETATLCCFFITKLVKVKETVLPKPSTTKNILYCLLQNGKTSYFLTSVGS